MTETGMQIEEIAKTMCFQSESCRVKSCTEVNCEKTWLAEKLYEAGYSKQSGWISVGERLPEQKVMVLGFCHTPGDDEGLNDRILVMELNRLGQFVPFNCSPIKDNSVTHWMPLPEPPKMKGGASDA